MTMSNLTFIKVSSTAVVALAVVVAVSTPASAASKPSSRLLTSRTSRRVGLSRTNRVAVAAVAAGS